MGASELRERLESLAVQYDHGTVAYAAADSKAAGLGSLIDNLLAKLGNVDEAEAEAILAKITEATAALAAGNYFTAVLALLAAFSLYRAAVKD